MPLSVYVNLSHYQLQRYEENLGYANILDTNVIKSLIRLVFLYAVPLPSKRFNKLILLFTLRRHKWSLYKTILNMDFYGHLVYVGEVSTFTMNTPQGAQPVTERTIVVENEGEYPESVALQIRKPELLGLPLQVGQRVKVSFRSKAQSSQNNPDYYFNKHTAWRIEQM